MSDTDPRDPGRFERLEKLFHAALALPSQDRSAFLSSACGEDAELRAEVERLLAVDAQEDGSFDALGAHVADLAAEALDEQARERAAESWEGRTVGPYRILGRLGQGGMGVVYLAERADVGRRVALKVVRGSLAAPELERRFLQERRVLARLEHPGIARLVDAGVDPDGTPWLTMDLVDGLPITRYCEERQLGDVERLRLFVEVCDAVAYAHARLVVHRDIKPANVLVDAEGRVRLLDFGIAKLLGEDEAAGEETRTGLRVFSPQYAAPEQALGEPVTTATDVHALGILLFEMLSGEHPYAVAGATPAAAMRVLAETEPRRLSTTGATSARGGRELPGDVDAICMKALARAPERRYASAQQFADDVSRYLHGYPVQARLPTARYRLGRFLRRNAAGVAAALLIVVALAVGLGSSLWQGARARAALAESQEVASFLAQLFEASNPAENRGRDINARELLEAGVRRIDELSAQPSLQARMLEVMARAYHGLGDSRTAHDLAERSLAQGRATLGASHAQVGATLHTLGEIQDELGDRQASVARFREALATRRSALGQEHEETTWTMIRLSRMLLLVGEVEEAEALTREALAIRRRVHGPRDVGTAAALESLGMIMWRGPNQLADAEALFSEALAIREEAFGPDDPRLDLALVPLASILRDRDRPDEGEALARRAVEIWRRVYGDDHPGVAYRLGVLGYVLQGSGRLEETAAVFRDVLERFRRHYPGDYPHTANTLGNIGTVFGALGQLDTALAYYAEAAEMWDRLYGGQDPQIALVYHNMGHALAALGRLEEAETEYRRAYEIRQQLYGERSAAAMRTGSLLADVLSQAGKHEEAERMLRAIASEQKALYTDGHRSLALTLERLATALERQGDAEAIEPLLSEALEFWQRSVAPEHEHRRRVAEHMIRLLEESGRSQDADRLRAAEQAEPEGDATL
jgi:eukaryotic-like serine/threonine-protein kinase